jgi:predicted alpha/beta-fold hydrolase
MDTDDGDFVDLDWHDNGDGPLVLLLHGLTGNSQSSYVLGLQAALQQHGMGSVALNFRGCSGQANRLARGYHSGDTADVHAVYQLLRQRWPQRPLAAVGFSLGGNVLLKWLGEQGDRLSLMAAVAVSTPLVLSVCATRLDTGFSRLYRNYLLRDLRQYLRHKHQHLQQTGAVAEADKLAQLGDLSRLRSFWQFDEQVVAVLHGYAGAADYYQRASARGYLKTIRVPSLVIQADDDPFMTPAVLPTAAELADCVQLERVRGGGHVGFVTGPTPYAAEYWLEQCIPEFLISKLPTN